MHLLHLLALQLLGQLPVGIATKKDIDKRIALPNEELNEDTLRELVPPNADSSRPMTPMSQLLPQLRP